MEENMAFRCPLSKSDSNNAQSVKHSSVESMELSPCSLSAFPDEILLKILKNLDLRTLRRMSQVNKRFNMLTLDFELYTCLNIRHVNLSVYKDVFSYFRHSCKNLKQLDLTRSKLDITDFVIFIDNCGRRLTHLRLEDCYSLNIALPHISKICKNLKELDLNGCHDINDEKFVYLEELNSLEKLNLRHTKVQTQSLCKILQNNQRMRELHLAPIWHVMYLDVIIVELGRSCPDLEAIYLDNTHKFRLQGINVLANCKNLRKLNYLTNITRGYNWETDNCLSKLLSSCQHLEEVVLYGNTFTDRILELLTQCKNLERLHLSSMSHVAEADKCSVIMEHCPKLKEFYLACCNISDCLGNQLKERYPHVSIKY